MENEHQRPEEDRSLEPDARSVDGSVEKSDSRPSNSSSRRKKEAGENPSLGKRIARAADGMDGTLLPTRISLQRIALIVFAFAILFALNRPEVRTLLLGEVTYEDLVEEGVVIEAGSGVRSMLEEEFEAWTRVPYYAPLEAGNYRGRITMLVDPNCPWCKRAFRDTEALNDRGISVEYVVVPRSRDNDLSMDVARTFYCAPDGEQREALEWEMRDAAYGSPPCDAERMIDLQMERAHDLGAGTTRPWSITEDGRAVVGYVEPERWVMIMEGKPGE